MLDIEQQRFLSASTDDFLGDSEGNKVRPLPFAALVYNLTQLFHCLPSQVLQEDNELLTEILTIHNAYAEIDESVAEAEERNRKAKITGKLNNRYMAIAVELEKLKVKDA